MQGDYGTLTTDAKKKILGLNAAQLYGLEVPAEVTAGMAGARAATGTGSKVPA
jgi:hypothetical protein